MTKETPASNLFPPDFADLSAAWMTAFLPGGAAHELPMRLFDPRQWLGLGGAAMEQPFETVLGLPRLADVPELDRKLLGLFQSWMTVAQRNTEYGVIVAQVWAAAYGDFLGVLQASAMGGQPVRSGRELLDRWAATVNERLLKAQRSDRFLAAQRRLLDAMLSSRAAESELVAIAAKAVDLPSRAEIDDVHRTLHAVKRELRALKRQLAEDGEDAMPVRRRRAGPAGPEAAE